MNSRGRNGLELHPNFPFQRLLNADRREIRLLSTSTRRYQQAAAEAAEDDVDPPPSEAPLPEQTKSFPGGIRNHLRKWQELNGRQIDANFVSIAHPRDQGDGETPANTGRLADVATETYEMSKAAEEETMIRDAFLSSSQESVDTSESGFVNPGDLVELEFTLSERESILAIHLKRQGKFCHIFTIGGRWVLIQEADIQYSVPGFMDPDKLAPLLPYLPTEDQIQERAMSEAARHDDVSVPREFAAPLISQMQRFLAESQEIYRRHAGVLDTAHDLLAHPTDLRYNTIRTVAQKLLDRPGSEISKPELFTVRKAISHVGFGFSSDRRSHRITGHLQIRSKEQVKMVNRVRDWVREWQDDMALRTALGNDEQALQSHTASAGAANVYAFIAKAKRLIEESRWDRRPTPFGHPGPSKKRFSLLDRASSVREVFSSPFTTADSQIARFMEAWACSDLFYGIPRLGALPPLILQATGFYGKFELNRATGFLFLQEIGICTPYENRVRYDRNLLLPSSQHSKPVQELMNTVMGMRERHGFVDSMRDLRHDWGDLPVYCIDDASAHEIDDGISIEDAGEGCWWAHIHIANPTAFFDRNHPVAQIARHMGGTVYLEDNTYMMMPQWASQGHFSLAKDRPCLTISAKLDSSGRLVEHSIRSGYVRNVIRLTPEDVATLLDGTKETVHDRWHEITVGGEPPRVTVRQSDLSQVSSDGVRDLGNLRRLARLRANARTSITYYNEDRTAKLEVWASNKNPGLGWKGMNWDRGRTVEGDPVIRMLARKDHRHLSGQAEGYEFLIREWMILACQVAGLWCAERGIPSVFRGTEIVPDSEDPDVFLKEVLEPAIGKRSDGRIPMHLSRQHLLLLGRAVLSTRPMHHATLGLDHYSKATSPLRRYADMIVHWQVEAALREEARLGRSLVVAKGGPKDRSFLPFPEFNLKKLILGIQPRERVISYAENYSRQFWIAMLLFRAIHFGETALPLEVAPPPDSYRPLSDKVPSWSYPSTEFPYTHAVAPPMLMYKVHAYVRNTIKNYRGQGWFPIEITEFGIVGYMERPEGLGLGEAQLGDVWECRIHVADPFHRRITIIPVKLIERDE